jgi:putative phosphoesterase
MKIGLISDVHATPGPLQEALVIFQDAEVDMILCAGDIVGYGHKPGPTVALLQEYDCQVIMGNHDLWWLEGGGRPEQGLTEDFLRGLPATVELTVSGKRIHMVHASPPESSLEGIKLLDEKAVLQSDQMFFWDNYLKGFPFDVLVVGHTHQVFSVTLGSVLVVNPGSTLFNHTCAILSLPEMEVEIFSLSGKEPVLSWNWGQLYADVQR